MFTETLKAFHDTLWIKTLWQLSSEHVPDASESIPRYTVDWLLRSPALRLGHARASTVATLALRSSKTLKMLEVPQNTVGSTPTV